MPCTLDPLERKQAAAQLWNGANMATGEPILVWGAVGRFAKNFGVAVPAGSRHFKALEEHESKVTGRHSNSIP